MKQETWYTIHFEAEETGENSDDFVFATKDELTYSTYWDYPGYGSQSIKEISRDEALDVLIPMIDEDLEMWLSEVAIDVDPEDYEIVEPAWFGFAADYIKWGNPGWQLLYEEYFEDDKQLKAMLIEKCKKEMRVCKELFETGQRKYMPDGYYTAEKVLTKIDKEERSDS